MRTANAPSATTQVMYDMGYEDGAAGLPPMNAQHDYCRGYAVGEEERARTLAAAQFRREVAP